MKARHQRLSLIVAAVAVLGGVVGLILYALGNSLAVYISPSDVKQGRVPQSEFFRIGGHVKEDSLQRESDGVTLRFIITDRAEEVPVYYKGILPDLFKEGKGVVAQGKLSSEGHLIANEVLAKHDENYMPPEAVQAIHDAQQAGSQNASAAPPPVPETAATRPQPATDKL